MAGGLNAAIAMCWQCAGPADREREGLETDWYLCRTCGFRFGLDFDGSGPPTEPLWPVASQHVAAQPAETPSAPTPITGALPPEGWQIVQGVLATMLSPLAEASEVPTILVEIGGPVGKRVTSIRPGGFDLRQARELAVSRMEAGDGSAVGFPWRGGREHAAAVELWLKGMDAPVRYLQRHSSQGRTTGPPIVVGTCSWRVAPEEP